MQKIILNTDKDLKVAALLLLIPQLYCSQHCHCLLHDSQGKYFSTERLSRNMWKVCQSDSVQILLHTKGAKEK
jgi:hypothetical protein